MTLILTDLNQLDPRAVWIKTGTVGSRREIYMVHRDTDKLVTDLPFGCGMLPHPMQNWFNQERNCFGGLVPRDMTIEEAIHVARAAGFRIDLDDVTVLGDPGYIPQQIARREKVFSARRRTGRPGETPVTVIMVGVATVDSNGFTAFDCLPLEEIPDQPVLLEDCTDEIFLTHASPEDVKAAWLKEGFVERSDVVGCFHPCEMFAWVSEPCSVGELVLSVTPRGDYWMDDDLRDHSLTVIPPVVGENICENQWAIRRGVSREVAWSQIMAAGFVPMPEDMRDMFE